MPRQNEWEIAMRDLPLPPGELFCDREVAWQATARGDIVAALETTPPDHRNGPLTQLLERALTEVERA